MDNFDLKKYLAEGKLHENTKEEIKTILTKSYPGAYSEEDFEEIINLYNTKYKDYRDYTGELDGVEQAAFKFNYANNRDIMTGMKAGSKSSTSVDFPEMEDEFEGAMSSMSVSKEEYLQDIINASADEIVSDNYFEIKNAVEQGVYSKDEVVKLAKTWAKGKLSGLAEGRLLKEDVSPRFIKKYLSSPPPKDFKSNDDYFREDQGIEDIESYSDRDKAILIYLETGPGIIVNDKVAKGIKGKSGADIIKYFQDETYTYMPYGEMRRVLGIPAVAGFTFDESGSDAAENWYLTSNHVRQLNKIWRAKYPELDLPKFNKDNFKVKYDTTEALNDYYRKTAREQRGEDLEVTYEEYAEDYVQFLKDDDKI